MTTTREAEFTKLWDSGLFEDVTLEKDETPQGVVLTATVVERPTIADLEFRGNKKLTTSQLKDKLKEGKPKSGLAPPSPCGTWPRRRAFSSTATRRGIPIRVIEAQLEIVSPAQRRVVFNVDEGDKMKVESINFSGNTSSGRRPCATR